MNGTTVVKQGSIALTKGSRHSVAEAPGLTAPGAEARFRARRALTIPLALAAALAALCLLPSVRQHTVLMGSLLGGAGLVAVWVAAYLYIAGPAARPLGVTVSLRSQHYLQAATQLSIMLYWGWYWREVYASAHLFAAQILFAYAFDMLLSWMRRGTYTLGFGPLPIIFSINLFLWFKPDWFYLQFAMVAVGFLAKEFITWQKEGRRTHVFNPSSFPLALFSLGMILTGSTHISWGAEIASTFEWPEHIRLWIFVACLVGQFRFGITTMTMSAVLAVVGFGMGYYWVVGTYYFVDAFIPAAVFLGMHLLFTDPSTSPRTELGRILYGLLYGLGVVALFGLLGYVGVPTFYDKLLAVPLLNVCIQLIDAVSRSGVLRRLDPAQWGRSLSSRQRRGAYVAIWVAVFVFVSDPAGAYRPKRWVPFWEQACAKDLRNGCRVLSAIEAQYCRQGSGWACNEIGILVAQGRADVGIPPAAAFQRACQLGVAAACANFTVAMQGQSALGTMAFQHSQPLPADYPFLLQEGKGPLDALAPEQLYAQACKQGWADGCQRLARERLEAGAADPTPGE